MLDWREMRTTLMGHVATAVVPPRIKLPMLPQAILEFTRKAEDPEAGPLELAVVIEADSGLTCELLRYVNSSGIGLRRKVGSAQQAITLLGIRSTKLFLLTSGMQAALSSQKSRLINFRTFWAANLERALFAREVAGLLRADAELAFAAAMLQDSLLPIVTNELPRIYLQYASQLDPRAPSLVEFEQRALGWNHAFAAAKVMREWRFPDDLLCCILLHHRGAELLADPRLGRTAAAAVAVASLLPDPFQQARQGHLELLALADRWPDLALLEIAHAVDRRFDELSPGIPHEFPLRSRVEAWFSKCATAVPHVVSA